ncbi:citron Rho-interacting kinase [Agrilus planipennis]|uniref:non-specific serine/threonine protein kinase n=1 Tax=Agrilus planipennis TaxID=224129 RepID=A0A1W4WKY3_AGRPL|nr:citron Rho-interacting kinase [Agrilus planipennis]
MELITESINTRASRLNAQLLGKTSKVPSLIYKENILDALFVLYDECNNEHLKKNDKNILTFVNKYRKVMSELKNMRVNIYDFEIKAVIGRGHFGEVHLVKEKQTGDYYALKSIKKSECLDMKSASFEEERNIMASTQSAWHTTLQYSFQDSMYLYLAMEYHSGGDLLGLLGRQGGTIPESAATFYLSEIIIAIHDLHSMGYVHRDIKPDNILLDRLGHIKLADFGSSTKLTSLNGVVSDSLPVGTPDYVAPEVLQSMDNKYKQESNYNHLCDYWSLGVIAYQLTVGTTPFVSTCTVSLYSKIINHSNSWKYPSDIVLSQAYVSLTKALITDQNSRLDYKQIIQHDLFKNVNFNTLKDQVPPFVPKVLSVDDTSNFSDVVKRKSQPDIENFKSKTQFSGRNLPFVGFTYIKETQDKDSNDKVLPNVTVKDERVQHLLKDIDSLQRELNNQKDVLSEKNSLETKLYEKCRKLESVQNVRDRLERDLANSIAECSALKRTLELERKNQVEIERKALDLIKSAKLKWENLERNRIDALNGEIEDQKRKIEELSYTNNILRNQLEQALQMKDKQQESLQKVHSLNRRSVMGLESRLEKITTECQDQLCDLENKLSEEIHNKKVLQNHIDELKKSEIELKKQLSLSNEARANLKREVETCNETIKELQHTASNVTDKDTELISLRNEIEILTKKLKELKDNQRNDKEKESLKIRLEEQQIRWKSLQQKIDELRKELFNTEKKHKEKLDECLNDLERMSQEFQLKMSRLMTEKESLATQLEHAQVHIETNVVKVKTLEELLARLESGVSKLENETERENVLKEQVERLEQQLLKAHETSALEKQELSQLKIKCWRMEKSLDNAEIDKRILKRELKEVEDRAKQLSEDIMKLQNQMEDSKKAYESALLELSNLNENLATEVMKLQSSRSSLEDTLKIEREKFDKEKSIIDELKSAINSKEKENASLLKKIDSKDSEKKELEFKLEKSQSKINELLHKLDDVIKDKTMTESEMEKYKRELQNTQMNSSALREACSLLESQLVEYEKLHEASMEKEKDFCNRIDKLLNDLSQTKQEVNEAKRQMNEEKSFRLMTETKNKSLQEDVESLQKECRSYKDQCCEFKSYSSTLSDELTLAEERINDLEITIKTLERQIENLYAENQALKEDCSIQLTNLNNSKEMNYDLLRQISEYKDENLALLDRISELENMVIEKTSYYKDRELKHNATVQQQIKLIHFLQSKVEDAKKKKTFADKLFGHSKKENTNYLLYQNNKDIQDKEKKKNQQIEMFKHPNSGSRIKKEENEYQKKIQQNSSLSAHLNEVGARSPLKEKLPSQNSDKSSSQSLQSRVPIPPVSNTSNDNGQSSLENVVNEGWVKTPNKSKNGWEKTYAVLTPNILKIYPEYPTRKNATTLDFLELCQPDTHGKVILDPLESEIETPVSENELNYTLKVEISPNTTCWPPKSIVLMTLNEEEKEKWFRAFQSVLRTSDYKYVGEVVATWLETLDVNCLVELSNGKKLLGTEQGLYSLGNDPLTNISGPDHVQQIALLPTVHLALMIIDVKRYLITCDLNLLESLSVRDSTSKPYLPTKRVNVNNLSGFHTFQCSDFTKRMLVCVATAKQLIVLKFDIKSHDFVPLKVLDTAEPTSCMLFLGHSILVGADKFFEVDLHTFEAEEFIDPSDPRLAHATLYCQRMRSFPLYVAPIATEKEFLLCYSEFATFVDAFGRATRDREIKWTRLPRAFHYHSPYLYVVQFTAIEVFRIGQNHDGEQIECFRIELEHPRLLGGAGKGGIYIGLEHEVRLVEGKELNDDGSSVCSRGYEEEDATGSEFSFTSSLVQTLEGLSSDMDGSSDVDIKRTKKVKFPDL